MSVSSFLRILRWFLVPAAAFVICPPEAFAQEQGRLQGRVFIEGTRDPVEGAVVRLDPPMYQANGFDLETMAKTVETVTDSGGRFAFTFLRSGLWETTISAEGYFDTLGRIEVTQILSKRCSLTQQRYCRQPIDFYMPPVKSGSELKAETALVDVPDFQLDQAKIDLTAADNAYNAGDFRTALAGYNKLISAWPHWYLLHQEIGDAHRGLAEFEEALASYERFLIAEPDNEGVKRKIPRTKLLMGDLDAAGELAAAGGAASREDHYNLGEVEFEKGNIDVAADWYEKAVAADPAWEWPVFKLGMVALNQGDIEGAKARFQKVIDLAPDSEAGAQAMATLTALP